MQAVQTPGTPATDHTIRLAHCNQTQINISYRGLDSKDQEIKNHKPHPQCGMNKPCSFQQNIFSNLVFGVPKLGESTDNQPI